MARGALNGTDIREAFHAFAMYRDLFYVHGVFRMCSSECQQTRALLENEILPLDKKLVGNIGNAVQNAASAMLAIKRGCFLIEEFATQQRAYVEHLSRTGQGSEHLSSSADAWAASFEVACKAAFVDVVLASINSWTFDRGEALVDMFRQKLVRVAGLDRAAQLQSLLCRGRCQQHEDVVERAQAGFFGSKGVHACVTCHLQKSAIKSIMPACCVTACTRGRCNNPCP
jgi:hypothetical protein